MNYSRVAIAKCTEDVQAKTGSTCPAFTAKLKIFQKAGSASPSSWTLSEITTQSIPCINPTDQTFSNGDQIMVAQTVDETWVVLPTGTSSSSSGHPRFQFVTTGKMTNRAVTVKVLRVQSGAFDPDSMNTLVPGDTLTVYDPFRLWSDVEPKATGWAFLAEAQADDPTTEDIDEEHVLRYEIEECTQPINRLEGKLISCMYPDGETVKVAVALDDAEIGDAYGDIQSSYPNIDYPELDIIEDTAQGSMPTTYKYIECANPYNLDGIQESYCVIKKISNRQSSDPENYEAPKERSATQSGTKQWVVESVEKKFARRVKATHSGGTWTYVDHYDGYWPSINTTAPFVGCSPTITCEDPGDCLEDGAWGYAFFSPRDKQYLVDTTNSALWGEPVDAPLVADASLSNCTLNGSKSSVKVFCPAEDAGSITGGSIPTTTQTVSVAAEISIEDCGRCEWTYMDDQVPCGQSCHWEWDLLDLNWRKVGADCSGQCDCNAPDIPANWQDLPDGSPGPDTPCTVGAGNPDWIQTSFCEGACNCVQPERPPYPEIGTVIGADCTGSSGENKRLCVTTERRSFATIDCGGNGTSTDNLPPAVSCIPIEEDCPDACANPVS